MIDRQKLIGWMLIIFSGGYLVYFLKIRVLTPGPLLTRHDWVNLITSLVLLMIGTINVRLAAIKDRNRRLRPPDR